MARYTKKLHLTSSLSLSHFSKYAYKYKDSLSISPSPTIHKRTKYLKVIRKMTAAYGSFQKLENPFSPASCSNHSSQYLKLLKRYSKHIQSVHPHQILSQQPQFQRLISSFPLKMLIIDAAQSSGFQVFLQSRFCQIVKLMYKQTYFSQNQPVCLHTLQKILSDTPRRDRLHLPAAVLAYQAAGRRLSFEPDREQDANINQEDNGTPPFPAPSIHTDSARITQKTLGSSLHLIKKNYSKFFSRGIKLRALKKMVIEISINRDSIQMLKNLNHTLQKNSSIELEIYVKGICSLSNSEKNELIRLADVWKRVSLLSFDLKGTEVSVLDMLKPMAEALRNVKKIELKVTNLDQGSNYQCLEALGSLPSGLLHLSIALKQVGHSEVLPILNVLKLPKGVRSLYIRLSEACANFSTGFNYSNDFNNQYKNLYKTLMDKMEKVSGGKLELKIKEREKNRTLQGPASIGKRQRNNDIQGTHYLETPRKRGNF